MNKLCVLLLALFIAVLVLPVSSSAARRPAAMNETITFFYYKDLAAAVPFYEDLLQLDKTMDEDWVKIYRITATSSVGLVQDGRGFHAASEDKPAMLSIVTDDIDAWHERMQRAGVVFRSPLPEPEREPGAGDAPVRGFVVEDPGGYTIEFFTWLQPR